MVPMASLQILVAIFFALSTCYLLAKFFGQPSISGRYASVDGLRGYLAFFVFLHHSSVWFFYLKTGRWVVPPSKLHTHLGQSSVALFFMITAFLFFSKVLTTKKEGIDWGNFLVSRFMRLVPLYGFVMLIMLIVVGYLSNGVLNEPVYSVLKTAVKWTLFTVFGGPDLNGVKETSIILAGVTWSLPYEWFFYLALPVLSLATRNFVPLPYLLLSCGGIAVFAMLGLNVTILMSFLGGIGASFLVKKDGFRCFARTNTASIIIIICLATTIGFYSTAYSAVPLLLLSIAFALIASGNNLFGILVCTPARVLGEMAYSIYLLHGIVLFIVFTFIVGSPVSKEMSYFDHWLLITAITPVLLLISFVTFKIIEIPAMRNSGRVTIWLRTNLTLPNKRPTDIIKVNI